MLSTNTVAGVLVLIIAIYILIFMDAAGSTMIGGVLAVIGLGVMAIGIMGSKGNKKPPMQQPPMQTPGQQQ